MFEFTNILIFFDLSFRPLLRRSKWSNLRIFWILSTFWPFDLYFRGLNDRIYRIILNFSTFRPPNLLIWDKNCKFYQSCWNFSTFWPLVWTSKCCILLNMLHFSTSRSLIGGLITGVNWIFWIFSTFRPFNLYFGGLNDRIYAYFEYCRRFDLLTSTSEV